MRTNTNRTICFIALLLLGSFAGCADPDKGGVTPSTSAPTVTVVTPPNGNVAVCPNTAVVSATFSKPMNPATINTSTFKLTGTGGASVAGSVTYNPITNVA